MTSKEVEFSLEDDDVDGLRRLRDRIQAAPLRADLGVALYAPPSTRPYSQLTVPVWRAYCEKHGYDFVLQEENLVTGLHPSWTVTRLLLEVLQLSRWKYVMLVEPNSLPVKLKKGYDYVISEHMRTRRFKNDNVKERLVFCPWDCEREYKDHLREGSCYGPLLSGCIFWAKKKRQTLEIVRRWHLKRLPADDDEGWDPNAPTAVVRALDRTKSRHFYAQMFWKDVQKEMGRTDSKFLATFHYSSKHKFDRLSMIQDHLLKNRESAAVVNRALGNSSFHPSSVKPKETTEL